MVYQDLHYRAVLHARQAVSSSSTRGRATPTSTTRVPTPSSSSSSSRPRETTTSSARSTSTTISSTTTSSRPVSSSSSSSLISTSQTSKSLAVPSTTTTSSVSSSVPTSQAAVTSTRKSGSLAGVIIGILVAILVIILVIVFIFKRVRKRRDRVDGARFFNKDKLERPGMVQGIAAGPGVSSLHSVENEKDSQPHNIERSLPAYPSPFDTPQHRGISNLPPSPYGPGDPALHLGSSYSLNGGQQEWQQEWGAPPIPGSNGPAPYSPYLATFSNNTHSNNATTPPGSPFGRGSSMQNPFATPSGTDTHPSTPTSAAWPHTPMGAYHLPLLPGGAFANDSFRDSGYSAAAYSDVHVGQAYKVQVGLSMPKYEDLTTTTIEDTLGSPPPFTPVDTAAAVNTDFAYTDTAATHKSLPPRPLSTHTIYNPEDAYGGV